MDSKEPPLLNSLDLTGILLAGRYRVGAKLGEGGMASVYQGVDEVLDRGVAIKTVPRTNLSDVEVLRFQREARTASTISHPNLVQMLDFGLLDSGQPYMVMELLNGLSLDVLVSSHGPQRMERVFDIIEQIATGMSAVHRAGIIHRDLKASNVMLVDSGVNRPIVKILDFGIAKSFLENSQFTTLTQAGQIFGSPYFMSPEQARGEELDARSDIYSLGCITFNLLTGTDLFAGETVMEVVSKHISATPPLVSDILGKSAVPEAVDEFVARMLRKKREDRFQTMEEVVRAIRDLQNQSSSGKEEVHQAALPRQKQISTRGAVLACVLLLVSIFSAGLLIRFLCTENKPKAVVKPQADTMASRSMLEFDFIDEHASKIVGGESSVIFNGQHYNLLYVTGNRPTDRLNDAIKNHRQVQMIVVHYGSVTDGDVKLIAELAPISVNLEGSRGITDRTVKILSAVPTITALHFDGTKELTPKGLGQLSRLPGLTYISLKDCDLTDDHIRELAKVKSLRYIELQGNRQVTARILKDLSRKPLYLRLVADEGALSVIPSARRRQIYDDLRIDLADSVPDEAQQMSKIMGQEDSLVHFFAHERNKTKKKTGPD